MTSIPSWLDPQDAIDSDIWVKMDDETEGSTPDICWVMNAATRKRGLFKPDRYGETESYNEYVASKIAFFLDIPCAKIEVGFLFGKFGCISHDCNNERRHRTSNGDSLFRCDALFNNKRSDTNGVIYDSPLEISFMGLIPYVSKETEIDLIKMMFLDCIMFNPDRHGGNFSFYINRCRAISGLMPLYDHGLCMRSDLRDVSLFPYEGRFEPSFAELFRRINADYPEFVSMMMKRVQSDEFNGLLNKLECACFIQGRIKKFVDLM